MFFEKTNVLKFDLKSPESKGEVIPFRWTSDRKDAGTSSGKSGRRNLEAENVRSRAEGCVNLKTVTETRRSK